MQTSLFEAETLELPTESIPSEIAEWGTFKDSLRAPMRLVFFFVLLGVCLANQGIARVALVKQDTDNQPFIIFRTTVNKLRLRASPASDAPVVQELPENTFLEYLHETAGKTETITLRGLPRTARWYRVRVQEMGIEGASGWVFGGGVLVSSVFLPEKVDPSVISGDFLMVQKIEKTEFETKARSQYLDFVADTLQHRLSDTSFVLAFDNGTRKIIADTLYDKDGTWLEEKMQSFYYLGQIPSVQLYVVKTFYWEYSDFIFFDIRNGKMSVSEGYPSTNVSLSPNKKWLVHGAADPYETLGGLQFYLVSSEGVWSAFSFKQQDKRVSTLFWDAASGNLFFSWENLFEPEEGEVADIQYFKMHVPLLP